MIRPLGNRILIEQIVEKEKQLASGLYVSDETAPASIKAKVLEIGPDCTAIVDGDIVFVSQFGPTQVKENINDHTLMVSEDDVLAVLVPVKAAK